MTAEQIANQQAQLERLKARADGWGGDIVEQIPATEIMSLSPNVGGPRITSDYDDEWPKYYYWSVDVDLHPDGPRTPARVADDLEPWLEQQGWGRNKNVEFPPSERTFERDYFRDGYHLVVEAYLTPPPKVQTVSLTVVSPPTNPNK